MRENLVETNLINNEINTKDDNGDNRDSSFIKRASKIKQKTIIPKSSKIYNKAIHQIKKVNKLHRYKIGLIFYIIYILLDISELIVTILTKYDFDYNPFSRHIYVMVLLQFLFL